jgi:hypothetical protein
MEGVSQFAFGFKLAESSAKVLSQHDGQAVIRSTCLRGAGLQPTTWRLIWSQEEIDFSTYSHGILVVVSHHRQPNPPTPASHSGGALRQAWRARLPFASVGSGFRLEEEVRTAKEEVTGKSGLGQDDITALGGVLELCFIPDIKSPSRLGIYYRSRLDDVAARAFTPPDPIKRKPCECRKVFCRRGARASCTSCKSSASGCCLQHLFQDFKLRC